MASTVLDHLVVGARTLDEGARYIAELLGVAPQPGGHHPTMGTHNMVLRLGTRLYLEIIAIDPAAAPPHQPRWFGLDTPQVHAALQARPRLLTWVARTDDLAALVARSEVDLGVVHSLSRGPYQWQITIPADGLLRGGGLIPPVIQWQSATHPADALPEQGCSLERLYGYHPRPDTIVPLLATLGLATALELQIGGEDAIPYLSAVIATPRGSVTLAP